MILGKVSGSITSTINHPFYDNKRLLIVDRLTPELAPTGKYLIAVDTMYAGMGETVLVIDVVGVMIRIAPTSLVMVGVTTSVTQCPATSQIENVPLVCNSSTLHVPLIS